MHYESTNTPSCIGDFNKEIPSKCRSSCSQTVSHSKASMPPIESIIPFFYNSIQFFSCLQEETLPLFLRIYKSKGPSLPKPESLLQHSSNEGLSSKRVCSVHFFIISLVFILSSPIIHFFKSLY